MRDNISARAGPRQWVGLAVLALPTMLIGLDMTVLHLVAPALSASLRPGSSELLWIVDIYGFMVAGFLITMGTLGDRIGRRKLLLIGAAAFGLTSLLAAYSVNVQTLIAARALLGVAGATLLPSTLSLISNMFRNPDQRRFAIAVWMTNLMVGGAIGPLVGGVLLEHFWWGSVFLLSVPLTLLLLVAGPILLPEYRDPGAGRLDVISVALSIATIMPVVYGIKELAKDGAHYLPLLAIAVGLAVGVMFVRRQLRIADPMLDLSLITRSVFSVSLGAQTMGLFVLTGMQFLILQYFQLVLGLSPLQAGLRTMPAMIAGVVGTLLAPAMVRWMRPAGVMNAGFVLSIAGLMVITQIGGESGMTLGTIGFAILFFGISAALALTNDLIIGSVPPERAGKASGVGETGAELGNALGVAVSGSIATAVYRNQVTDRTLPDGIRPDFVDTARDTLGSAKAVAERLPGRLGSELLEVAQAAFTQGMRLAAIIDIGIVAGLLIAIVILLRRVPTDVESEAGTDVSKADVEVPEAAREDC